MNDPNDHDGIATLLRVPDPLERSLALKSKSVQPYHLRMALESGDPSLRAQVASHPKLTKELIREILSSDNKDDKDLKHLILKRPDLEESELRLVTTDPEHALEVARHKNTTDSLRNEALDSHIPEGVKVEHQKRLLKSIGHITYPLLGEGKVYTNPMPVKSHTEAEIRNRYVSGGESMPSKVQGLLSANYRDTTPVEPHLRQVSGFVKNPVLGPASIQTSKRMAGIGGSPSETYKLASKVDAGKALGALEGHEAQHSVFSRLAQKHGNQAATRVVATTLSKLPEEHREHIKNLYRASGAVTGDPTVDPEETIAYLHNYLQDPNRRNKIHAKLGFHTQDEQRNSVEMARQAWNKLRKIGMSLRPEDVGINPKDEQKRLADWVKKLSKRESNPSEQLGFSVSFHELIAIAQFLTNEEVGMEVIRQALRDNDGDPTLAVLTAYGLNTPEGRKAFENVKQLKLHKAEDILKAPKVIVSLDGSSADELVKKAYRVNEVEPISLNGKHSSGTYIVQDEDANNYLLKPGSGKKSPAAGIDETKGSQSRREAAFSALAQVLGIEEVMPCFLLGIDGKEVAMIKMWPSDWINLHKSIAEDTNTPRRALERYLRNGKLFKWSVLDFIAGSADRHGNNILVGPEEDGNKIGLIDHGSSFSGFEFDPAHDSNSFVPYYLRVWAGQGFHGKPYEEQLKQMPKLTGESDESLRDWVESINEGEIKAAIERYNMDPAAPMARLKELKDLVAADESASEATNKVWLAEPLA